MPAAERRRSRGWNVRSLRVAAAAVPKKLASVQSAISLESSNFSVSSRFRSSSSSMKKFGKMGRSLQLCGAQSMLEEGHKHFSRGTRRWLFSRLAHYAIGKFAESLKMVPQTLAENAGLNAIDIVSSLYAEHANGNVEVGINLEEGTCKDVSAMNVWDLYITKFLRS